MQGMKPLARLLCLSTLPAAAGLAGAAELQVYVITPDGKPATDVVVMLLPAAATASPPPPPAEPAQIVQQDIRFVPYVTAVPQGATVRFVNRDRFDHHVKSVAGGPLGSIAPAQSFEFRLKAARASAPSQAVRFDAPGATGIGCHLHGSMRAHVFASPTPWVAVTDAAGKVTLTEAPDGAADLRLWHPDQLTAQAQLRVTLGATPQPVQAALNFSPKPRPAPRQPYSNQY